MSVSPTVVEYRLDEWAHDSRLDLASLLRTAAVPHEWRGASLLVPDAYRAQVDRSIAVLAPPPVSLERGAPAGWYVDPLGQESWRWWDGHRWLANGATEAVRERPWAPAASDHDHGIRGGVLAFFGFLAAIALDLAFSAVARALGVDKNSLLLLCIGEAGLWIGMFGTCVIVARRNGSPGFRGLGLMRLRGQDWGAGAVTAVVARVVCAVIAVLCILIFPLHSFQRTTNAPTHGIQPSVGAAIVLVLIVCVGAPFFEELFFRGVVLGVLTRRWGARVAIVVQALAFALVHYQRGMTLALATATWGQIAVAGFFLGVLKWRYERLGPGMVAHGLFNAVVIAVVVARWL
jgi:membrane protease YdiL (CAAX protease family)